MFIDVLEVSSILMDLDWYGWIWIDMDWYGLILIWEIWIYGYMDIRIYGYMDLWIYGFMDIWIFGCIQMMVGCSWGGRAAALPTREFMRGFAPQTPHRFDGHTPPHPTPPHSSPPHPHYFFTISHYFITFLLFLIISHYFGHYFSLFSMNCQLFLTISGLLTI